MKIMGKIVVLCVLLLMLTACDGKSKQVQELMQSGIEYMESEDYERAIRKFDEALKVRDAAKLGATELDLLQYRAEAQFRSKNYLDAAHTYSLLADVQKNGAMYLNLRIICLAKSVLEVDKALELYEEQGSERESHLYSETTMELIKALVKKTEVTGDVSYREKAQDMLIALESSRMPKDANVANLAGMIYFRLKNYEKALQWFELGLGYDPEHTMLLYNKAICHEFLGDFALALEEMQAYNTKFSESDEVNHEIMFLKSRVESN